VTERGQQRLLIVEDDPEIQFLLTAILGQHDREIIAVGSGSEAEVALAQGSVDLIVLDLILPDLDGRTLLTRLRGRPETATVPIVVISARGGSEIRQDCYALGADLYTEKPFDPDEVAADISARLARSAASSPNALRDPLTGLPNRAGLLERFTGRAEPSGLALVQLDGFLEISERWGWTYAEGALKKIGDAIASRALESWMVCRFGGGEYVVWAPGATLNEVAENGEVVLEAIRAVPVDAPDGESFRFTASIGVVDTAVEASLDDTLELARQRLFRARESGRNQVVSHDEESKAGATRVLVAEDDNISATILLHRLEKEGLEVVRYSDGRAAYEGALEDTPDLVILDIKMPGMDGFEVLERLRRTPSYSKVPIILLTSMGSEADVVRGFQLGADDYILKPFSPVELSARVWRLLRRGRSASAI
jgi:diguanylate cyclase (GGDEF)-like protein